MQTTKFRRKLEIATEILEALSTDTRRITHLMNHVGINYGLASMIISNLIRAGMIEEAEESHPFTITRAGPQGWQATYGRLYQITPAGIHWLGAFRECNQRLKSLESLIGESEPSTC